MLAWIGAVAQILSGALVLSLLTAIFAVIAHPANVAAPIISGLVAVIGLVLLYTRRANEYFRN